MQTSSLKGTTLTFILYQSFVTLFCVIGNMVPAIPDFWDWDFMRCMCAHTQTPRPILKFFLCTSVYFSSCPRPPGPTYPLLSRVLTESAYWVVGWGCGRYPCRWLWSRLPGGTRRVEKDTLSPTSSWAWRQAALAAIGASASCSTGPKLFLHTPLSSHSQPSAFRVPQAAGVRQRWEKTRWGCDFSTKRRLERRQKRLSSVLFP